MALAASVNVHFFGRTRRARASDEREGGHNKEAGSRVKVGGKVRANAVDITTITTSTEKRAAYNSLGAVANANVEGGSRQG